MKGRGFESLQERREKKKSPGSTICVDLISVKAIIIIIVIISNGLNVIIVRIIRVSLKALQYIRLYTINKAGGRVVWRMGMRVESGGGGVEREYVWIYQLTNVLKIVILIKKSKGTENECTDIMNLSYKSVI